MTVRGLAVRIAQWTRPIPNLDIVSGCTRKRKLQALELLTGSPVKRLQIEKKKQKNLNVTKSTYARVKKKEKPNPGNQNARNSTSVLCAMSFMLTHQQKIGFSEANVPTGAMSPAQRITEYVGLYYCNKQTVHWLIPHLNVQYLHLILMCLIEMQQT